MEPLRWPPLRRCLSFDVEAALSLDFLAVRSLKLTRSRVDEVGAATAEDEVEGAADAPRERCFRLPPLGLLLLMGSALK